MKRVRWKISQDQHLPPSGFRTTLRGLFETVERAIPILRSRTTYRLQKGLSLERRGVASCGGRIDYGDASEYFFDTAAEQAHRILYILTISSGCVLAHARQDTDRQTKEKSAFFDAGPSASGRLG